MQKYALIALVLATALLLGCTGAASTGATPTPAATQQATDTNDLSAPTQQVTATQTATVTPTDAMTSSTPTAAPTKEVMEVQVINMVAKQWVFEPATLTVKKGVPVKLVITNPDVAHGIAIPDLGIKQNLPVGETTTVEFTPDKAGTFTFFCNVFCGEKHRDMKGTITVTG